MTRLNFRSAQEYLTDIYFALLMTALVFTVSEAGYMELSNAKWPVFLFLSAGYTGAVILLHLVELLRGECSVSRILNAVNNSSWMQRFLVLFLLFTLTSAALSQYPTEAWLGGSRKEGALTIGLYILSCLLISMHGRPKAWMVHLLAITVTAQCVICILQLRGGNPLHLYTAGMNYFDANQSYSGVYLGTIGNADFLGAYFCLVLPILWVSLMRMKTRWRFAYLIPLLLGLYVAARMWVLSCVVGVAVGFVIALPIVFPAEKKTRRQIALALMLAAFLALLAICLFDFGGPFHALHALLHGQLPREIDSGRVYIWREVLRRVPEHLLFGTGPDTLSMAGIEPFRRFDEELGVMLQAGIDTAHCEYLNVLYHQGLLALMANLAALSAALWMWLRSARERPASAILGAAVLAYVIQAGFNISVFIPASLFWAVLGLLDGCTKNTNGP